jgi:hypothetical protein
MGAWKYRTKNEIAKQINIKQAINLLRVAGSLLITKRKK